MAMASLFDDDHYSKAFERFWSVAKKGSKRRAWKRWQQHGCEQAADLLTVIYLHQVREREIMKDAGQFAPALMDTEGWLNRRRFLDEPLMMEKLPQQTCPRCQGERKIQDPWTFGGKIPCPECK